MTKFIQLLQGIMLPCLRRTNLLPTVSQQCSSRFTASVIVLPSPVVESARLCQHWWMQPGPDSLAFSVCYLQGIL